MEDIVIRLSENSINLPITVTAELYRNNILIKKFCKEGAGLHSRYVGYYGATANAISYLRKIEPGQTVEIRNAPSFMQNYEMKRGKTKNFLKRLLDSVSTRKVVLKFAN